MDIFNKFKKEKESERNKPDEKDVESMRVMPEIESDPFGDGEALDICDMVIKDAESDKQCNSQWVEDRELDVQMYEGARPSKIENIDKDDWMADRNMGLCAGTCDTFQSTLLATCYNADTLHAVATETNDVDMKDNVQKFAKWMVGEQECNVYPEVDDFIHNKIVMGTAAFFVHWKVWYEWVDRRMPKYDKQRNFQGYDIKTEKKRFEKGVLENIDNIDDLLVPAFGDTLQKKAHLIKVIHKKASDLLDEGARNIYKNIDEKFVDGLKQQAYLWGRNNTVQKEKDYYLGLQTYEGVTLNDLRDFPVDLFEWYGKYERNGKIEEYRITVEPMTKTLLALKPLRKITRSGKRPFVGSGFIRVPGRFQGKSLPRLIQPITNAFNNVWNQKSDFQYVNNVPFGFFKPDENFQQQTYRIKPGDFFPTDDPKNINVPNLSRSMAWADQDFQTLMMLLEKLTGAASYFMSNNNTQGTATRDVLINQKSETRFGKWVNRLILDISGALTMLFQFYQDWAPPGLGERVLGEDSKPLFPNLSIETIRGGYDIALSPDIVSGSKTMEREIALWGLRELSQTIWFMPQVNPKGNWKLVNQAAKKMGIPDVDGMMPPEPKSDPTGVKSVKDKWTRIKQGEVLAVEDGDDVAELFMGFQMLKDKKYFELDKEYRANFDNYLFQLTIAFTKQMQQMYMEQQSNKLAQQMIQEGGQAPAGPAAGPGPMAPAPGAPNTGLQSPGGNVGQF